MSKEYPTTQSVGRTSSCVPASKALVEDALHGCFNLVLVEALGRSSYDPEDIAVSAELRGLAAKLDQSAGRVFQRACAWELRDSRRQIDLGAPTHNGSGTVASVISNFDCTAGGIGSFASGIFSRGKIVWATGDNAGLAIEVKRIRKERRPPGRRSPCSRNSARMPCHGRPDRGPSAPRSLEARRPTVVDQGPRRARGFLGPDAWS